MKLEPDEWLRLSGPVPATDPVAYLVDARGNLRWAVMLCAAQRRPRRDRSAIVRCVVLYRAVHPEFDLTSLETIFEHLLEDPTWEPPPIRQLMVDKSTPWEKRRIVIDPRASLPPEMLDRWFAFSAEMQAQALRWESRDRRSLGASLSHLRRSRPWAFLVPEIAAVAIRWARFPPMRDALEVAASVLPLLVHAGLHDPPLVRQPYASSLSAEAELMWWLEGIAARRHWPTNVRRQRVTNAALRKIVGFKSDKWRVVQNRWHNQVKEERARRERDSSMIIPIDEVTLAPEEPPLERWLANFDSRVLFVLSGGDPERLLWLGKPGAGTT